MSTATKTSTRAHELRQHDPQRHVHALRGHQAVFEQAPDPQREEQCDHDPDHRLRNQQQRYPVAAEPEADAVEIFEDLGREPQDVNRETDPHDPDDGALEGRQQAARRKHEPLQMNDESDDGHRRQQRNRQVEQTDVVLKMHKHRAPRQHQHERRKRQDQPAQTAEPEFQPGAADSAQARPHEIRERRGDRQAYDNGGDLPQNALILQVGPQRTQQRREGIRHVEEGVVMLKIILAWRHVSSHARRRLRMQLVAAPIVEVRVAQRRVGAQDEHVFRVAMLGCISEIEAARDHGAVSAARVDDDDLVVRGGVAGVEEQRHARARELAKHGGIVARLLAVRDHGYFDAAISRADRARPRCVDASRYTPALTPGGAQPRSRR